MLLRVATKFMKPKQNTSTLGISEGDLLLKNRKNNKAYYSYTCMTSGISTDVQLGVIWLDPPFVTELGLSSVSSCRITHDWFINPPLLNVSEISFTS